MQALPGLSILRRGAACFTLLLGLAGGPAVADPCAPVAPAGTSERVAAINWGLAQTLIALDIPPAAMADVPGYRKWVVDPPLPSSSVDIGRRLEPNLTVLAGSDPDLIVMSSFYDELARQLSRIAPVLTLDIYQPGGMPLSRAAEVTACLAKRFRREAALDRLTERLENALGALAAAVREPGVGRSVYVVQFRDADHVRVYGHNSLFGGVLREAGLDNAWQGSTNFWGFSTVPFTELDRAAGHLVLIEPVPREVEGVMADSLVWRALPAVRKGRVHRLDQVWAYGGLTSAIRFAGLLEDSLRGR